MNLTEFNTVDCHSRSMLDLIATISSPMMGQFKTIIIAGPQGSGRKTLARHLQKMHSALSNYEIIDTAELSLLEENKIYICHDFENSNNDSELITIQMPSLSERKEDLLALADFFVQVNALMLGKNKVLISEKAKEKILAYNWPGQFPELEQALENAVQTCEKNIIEPEHLSLSEVKSKLNFNLGLKLENVERQYILQTLFFAQQNRTKAAEILGISIRTLRNKLNQYRQEGYL